MPGETEFVELKPQWFQILLALADHDLHGYGIMNEVLERTDGRMRLWPATLYGSLKRMNERALIREVAGPQGSEENGRERRFYSLTETGRTALAEEARRLEAYVTVARARKVFERTG